MDWSSVKVAYGSVPKDGGTFTFYRNMRPELLARGVDLRCVSVGRREAELVESAYVDEGCVLLAEQIDSIKKQAKIFVEWCMREKVNVVMAINSVAILSALPHLPMDVRVVARCANAFDEGYRITMSCRERLTRIIALTPRLRDDLIRDYGADSSMIELIPNGIDPSSFDAENRRRSPENRDFRPQTSSPLQLGFLGRLEHNQKGVLYLPEIIQQLKERDVDFHLRIAGKGKHEEELKKQLHPFIDGGEVELIGALTKDEVPGFLGSIDVYLFTSHFEGCPNALLEAMMAGCAPVAFLIEGITNFVLAQGHTGFIAPMGDCSAFAEKVEFLATDRDLLENMQHAVRVEARERFIPEVASDKYSLVFREVLATDAPSFKPLPWGKFKIDPVYQVRGWQRFVPSGAKRFVKRLLR